MAGTSDKTKPVTARVPVDLVQWIETQDGTVAQVVVRALRLMKDGPKPGGMDAHLVPELQAKVATLEAEVKRLRALSVDRTMVGYLKQGNPVLASAVPAGLTAPATGFNLKGKAGR